MKYYEFNQLDYYALVRAKNRKEAAQAYINEVAYQQEDYEEVLGAAEQISEAVAFEKIKEAFHVEGKSTSAQELYTLLESDLKVQGLLREWQTLLESDIQARALLIDGSLF